MIDPLSKAVSARAKKPLFGKAEIEQLRDLQADYQTSSTALNVLYTESAAKTAWTREQTEHAALVRKGRVHEHVSRTYEDICSDYRAKQDAARQAMLEISREAAAIAKPICEAYAELCRETLAEVESVEEKTF